MSLPAVVTNVLADVRRMNRFRSLLRTYAYANSIIAARTIQTKIGNIKGEAPAWTDLDGHAITFNVAELGDVVTREEYVAVTGVNYHELSHVLYTPKRGHPRYQPLYDRIANSPDGAEFGSAFNVLEDQRIESLMILRAPGVRAYFQTMIAKFILATPEVEPYSALMLYGRTYLGQAIIDAAADKWAYDPALLVEAKDIIDRYRQLDLTDSGDLMVAITLTVQMMLLLRKIMPPIPPAMQHGAQAHCGAGGRDDKSTKREVVAIRMGKDKDDAKAGDELGDGEGKEPASGKGGQSAGGGQDEGDGEGSGKGESDDPNQDPSDKPGAGVGKQKGNHWDGTSLEDLIEALVNASSASHEVDGDYSSYRGMVRAGRLSEHMTPYPHWGKGIAAESTSLTNRIAREWQRLIELMEPGWSYREPQGRLSVQRYALGERDLDQLFDTWEEGNTDGSSWEGVVLADISGSMGAYAAWLSGACWTIKRSCDLVGAPLTIILYDSQSYMLYRRDDVASTTRFPSISATGGTNPHSSLGEALALLAASDRKRRYLFTMTDGEWGIYGRTLTGGSTDITCDDLVSAIASLPGTVTHMVYFTNQPNTDPKSVAWHNHQLRDIITSIADLPAVFRRGVSALLSARR